MLLLINKKAFLMSFDFIWLPLHWELLFVIFQCPFVLGLLLFLLNFCIGDLYFAGKDSSCSFSVCSYSGIVLGVGIAAFLFLFCQNFTF